MPRPPQARPLCWRCRRLIGAAKRRPCVVCGRAVPLVGPNGKGRQRLTCARRSCARVIRNEQRRAYARRRARYDLGGAAFGPDVCPRCLYETAVCRCRGDNRAPRREAERRPIHRLRTAP